MKWKVPPYDRSAVKASLEQICAGQQRDPRRAANGEVCKLGAKASQVGRDDTRDRRGGRGRRRGGVGAARARAVHNVAIHVIVAGARAESRGSRGDGRARRHRRSADT